MSSIEKSPPLEAIVSNGIPIDLDAANLANLGYKQEFKRDYNFLSTFSFALSISGLMGTISITYMYPMWSGGPAACVWCWFVGAFGCLCIAWSVAELTSCFPTSGGMIYVIKHVCPKKYAPLTCWVDGWLFLIGAITGCASTDFGAATLLLAIVSMYTDYEYVPTKGHTTAVTILIIISHALLNSLPGYVLASITQTYCFVNIGSTIALIVHLLVKCEKYNTRGFIFGEVINNTGWSKDGWAFLFGFLNVSWVMTSYDLTSRISEESKSAAKQVPLAIASALTTTAILGWVLCVVFAIVMGDDMDRLLNTLTGQPIVQLYYDVLGKQAATLYLSLAFVIIWFCGAVAMCYTSRSIWSLARDNFLPFSKHLHVLNKKVNAPVRAVWLLLLINSCISLINLGSTIAMNAVFSACAIATDWSYVICIGLYIFNADKMGVKKGPFNMGRFSKPVMSYACIWTIFVSIVFIFPNYMPVTPQNMNYTVVIMGFVFIAAGGWWIIDLHKWYKGPLTTVDAEYEEVIEHVQDLHEDASLHRRSLTKEVSPVVHDAHSSD